MERPFSVFEAFPELTVSFSTRADGDMKLKDSTTESLENRRRYFQKLGIKPEMVTGVLASHGADVIRVGLREAGAGMKHVDGLLTSEQGVSLSVTAGDCLAIYLYDPVDGVIALVHAGWRGLARGIISKALAQFADPARVRVAVSPFIQACHFEVGEDVADMFGTHTEAFIERDGKAFLDMGVIAWRQLLEAGVKDEYTEMSADCTACLKEKYFSYRLDKPDLNVMVAVMGMKTIH